MRTRLLATGHAVPERRRSSAEIERKLGLAEGWVERRTGIRERPVVGPGEATSDLAVRAAEEALATADLEREELALLLLATSTPDHLLPPSAPLVAHRLGLRCGATDVTGACTGFLYALAMADGFCRTQRRPALVIGANVLSRRVNPEDKATMALFSDGAGAAVLAPGGEDGGGLLGSYLGSDGAGYERIQIPAGGSRTPFSVEAAEAGQHLMQMEKGKAVFRQAVEGMVRAGRRALDEAGLAPADIDWWIPHQANRRITDRAGEGLGIPPARTVSIIETYGNSSAATIPLAWSIAVRDGRIQPGDTLLLTAVGAGTVEAGMVWRG